MPFVTEGNDRGLQPGRHHQSLSFEQNSICHRQLLEHLLVRRLPGIGTHLALHHILGHLTEHLVLLCCFLQHLYGDCIRQLVVDDPVD